MSPTVAVIGLICVFLAYLFVIFLMAKNWLAPMWGLILISFIILGIVSVANPGSLAFKDYLSLLSGAAFSKIVGTAITHFIVCIFAAVLSQTGIIQMIIKKAAELGGDKKILVSIIVGLACGYICIGAGSAAFIAVVTAIPILLSLGVNPKNATVAVCSGALLCTNWWAVRWALFTATLNNEIILNDVLMPFLVPYQAFLTVLWIIYIYNMLRKSESPVKRWAAPAKVSEEAETPKPPSYMMLMPIIPLLLIIILRLQDHASFIFCTIVTLALTHKSSKRSISEYGRLSNKLLMDSVDLMKYAMVTIFGIGVVQYCATIQPVADMLNAAFDVIMPTSGGLVLFIFWFAFIALGGMYRGPSNPMALGIGLFTILVATQRYPMFFIAGLLMTAKQMGDWGDPTMAYGVLGCSMTNTSLFDYFKKTYLKAVIAVAAGVAWSIICYL